MALFGLFGDDDDNKEFKPDRSYESKIVSEIDKTRKECFFDHSYYDRKFLYVVEHYWFNESEYENFVHKFCNKPLDEATQSRIEELIQRTLQIASEFEGVDKEKRIGRVWENIYEIKIHYAKENWHSTDPFWLFERATLPEGIEFYNNSLAYNTLYIAHPYKKNVYIPFDQSEQILLDEKLGEFATFVRDLGAKEISLSTGRTKSTDSQTKESINVSGGGSYEGVKVNAEYDDKTSLSQSEFDSYAQKINHKFNPFKGEPKLTEGLVWYEHEPSWQDFYKGVMDGRLQETIVDVQTESIRSTSESELQTVKASCEYLMVKANIAVTTSFSNSFKVKQNKTLHINVKMWEKTASTEGVNNLNITDNLDEKLEKIAKLKSLLDSGALTQEEFNKMKAAVLGF